MRCPADRAAYTQVKDQKTSELAPSVKARPITGPLGPIPDVSVDGGGPAAGDGCVSGTCTKLPGSSRPERASANGFANETARDGGDDARHRRHPLRPLPGQRDALEHRRRGRRASYGS